MSLCSIGAVVFEGKRATVARLSALVFQPFHVVPDRGLRVVAFAPRAIAFISSGKSSTPYPKRRNSNLC